MIFKDPQIFPNPEQELATYLQHNNDLTVPGYVEFLERLVVPLKAKLPKGASGLDFGSGPNPVMAEIWKSGGFSCRSYDPFFLPDNEALFNRFDFITCSETAEHFHHPLPEFERLSKLLRPGGWLGVMTQAPPANFADWWYHRDATHVAFYSPKTMTWIARRFALSVHCFKFGVTLFQQRL